MPTSPYHFIAPMPRAEPTFEGIPQEIRNSIFKYVFGPSPSLKPRTSTASIGMAKYYCNYLPPLVPDPLVDISILTTNKAYYRQAIDVLYGDKVVRGTISDLVELLQFEEFRQHVQKVEIADCISGYTLQDFGPALHQLRNLRQEKIRSIVILSDCLGYIANNVNRDFMPVGEFCDLARLGSPTCYDVGKYRLSGEFEGVEIHNRRLLIMWPSLKNVPEDYNPWNEKVASRRHLAGQGRSPNWLALSHRVSFRVWVNLHDFLFARAFSGRIALPRYLEETNHPEVCRRVLDRLLPVYACSLRNHVIDVRLLLTDRAPLSWCQFIPSTSLRSLGPGNSSVTLAWTTEYLSKNIAGCILITHTSERVSFRLHRSHWTEADGGFHTVEHNTKELTRALARHPTCAWIPDPLRRLSYLDGIVARGWILSSPYSRLVTGSTWIDSTKLDIMSPIELRELTHFFMAMNKPRNIAGMVRETEYGDEAYNSWASRVLQRYVGVAVGLTKSALRPNQAPRRDLYLRTLLVLLNAFARTGGHAPAPPPELYVEMWEEGFADLNIPLLWKLRLGWGALKGTTSG